MANILGTTNNDILIGTNLDDVLFGYAGDDELIGADGNDIIYGGLSNDRISGGAGNDQLLGEDGNDSIFGEDGNDALIGGTGNDALSGGNGNDYLEGDAGDDNLSGDAGNDTLYGGTGVDYLIGGSGNDLLGGEEGNDILYGNEDNDTLNGGDGDDFLDGGDGDDSLSGGRSNDNLYGGNGNDTLNGDRGIDVMAGEGGNDVYIVDNILDTVVDEGELDGFDTVRSTVSYTLVDNVESLVLEGSSNINATGNNQANVIYGNIGNNSLIGNAGGDTFIGSRGNDTINGGADSDAVSYNGLNQAITIKPQGVIDKGAFGTDQLIGIEAISGQAGLANSIDASTNPAATSIFANLASNQLSISGIPTIGSLSFSVYNFVNATGGAGNDNFSGNTDNNNFIGNAGNDGFDGSRGNDTINGGLGIDYAYYTTLGQAITLKPQGVLDKGTAGIDSLIGIENIIGQFGFANSIDTSSNPASVTINANLNSNQLSVNNIPVVGNLSFGVFNFANVIGGAGNDTITGGFYSNVLTGNAGNDTFIGSNSNDTINGGLGTDTADYSTLGQAITIKPQGVLDKGTAGIDSLIGIETIIGQAGLANSIDASTNPASVSINAYLSSNYLSVNGIPVVGSLAFNVQNFVNVTGGSANDSIYGNASNNGVRVTFYREKLE
jgi:Ca2+-binding RTX toxin-like protein